MRYYGKDTRRYAVGGLVQIPEKHPLQNRLPVTPDTGVTPPTDRGIFSAAPDWEDTVDPSMEKFPPDTPPDKKIMSPEDLGSPDTEDDS